jgi:ribose transport system ATP-binding protein
MTAADPATPLLELSGITKVYPGVVALDDVSFSLAPGEVVGLIGENGAGKSTLMKILGGVVAPTAGRIAIAGVEHAALTVQQSMAAGIAFVHQELNLFDNLDVAANVFLGREIRKGALRLVDNAAMARAVQPILARLGATFRPDTPVLRLSLAERQLLEIAKALSLDARVVIMDEPTSSLTLSETARLLSIIAGLKAEGIAVIFISHRLNEVEQCADRVVVLRDGRVAGRLARGEIAHDRMIRLMIGRDLKALYQPPSRARGEPVLKFERLVTEAHPDAAVNLDVFAGEILGLAGLVGAGRTELARAAFGIDASVSGAILLAGRRLVRHGPGDAIAGGLFLIPEDRKQSGLILEFSVAENIALPSLDALSRFRLVSGERERSLAEAQRARLGIKTPDVLRLATELSGGNQQKIVLAKWLAMEPKAVIFDEPTRGIDVGAKTEIYRLMRGLADHGVGILMISSDMEEVIGVSDRIAVMHNGRIAGELARDRFSEHNVLTLAVGRELEPV